MVSCPINTVLQGLGVRALAPICATILLIFGTSSLGFLPSSSSIGYVLWHSLLLFNTSWVLLRERPGQFSRNFSVRLALLLVLTTIFKVLLPILAPAFGKWSYLTSFCLLLMVNLLWKALPWYYQLHGQLDTQAIGEAFVGKFRPSLYFGATEHVRFTPVAHKFRYPLMYVGFPAEFEGTINALVSVRGINQGPEQQYWGKGKHFWSFFEVDPTRFYNPHLPFSQKLDTLLYSNGIDKSKYDLFFVTTPTFLGYSFNPVSYWYLYNKVDGKLEIVVLEVNNTFGEKHLYVIRHDDPMNPKTRKGFAWCGSIGKKFHISPFNHRSGSYQIHVADPLDPRNEKPLFGVHMVVVHRDGSKTMTAGVRSTEPGMDVARASWSDILYTVIVWGINQWFAIPRTMFEAWKTFRKGSVVYTRPEVLNGSGGRNPSDGEKTMIKLWLEYLDDRIQKYPQPLLVSIVMPQPHASRIPEIISLQNALATAKYDNKEPVPAELASSNNTHLEPPAFKHEQLPVQPLQLTIQVNNPRFFRRFFALQDPTQAIHLDILSQPYERHSAHINNLDLFLDVLLKSRASDVGVGFSLQPQHSLRWRMLSYCRRAFSTKLMTERTLDMVAEDQHDDDDTQIAMPIKEQSVDFDPLRPQSTTRFNTLDYYISTRDFATISLYRRLSLEAYLVDVVASGDVETFTHLLNIWKVVVYVARILVMIYIGISVGGKLSGEMLAMGINWSKVTMVVLFGTVNFGWLVQTVVGYL